VSAIMAAVWTCLFWRIAFRRPAPRRRLFGCNHRWHRIENYDDGRAKARCLVCSKVAIVRVNPPPARRLS
jgi:hypothetical protein